MKKTIERSVTLLLGVTILLIQNVAFAQERIRFDIPAQSLASALRLFQTQSGVPVLYSSELVANRQGAAVSGELTAIEAARQLLHGTGLEAEVDGGGRLTIRSAKQGAADQQLPEVEVSDSVPANPNLLPQPFAGGQVARGGQVGILGSQDIMDMPFSQSNYTSELMQNQQVRHIADVLANDPTAHSNAAASSGADDFSIRGFYVGNTDLLFNGMPGIAPSFFNSMMAESIERVEVLKGPNAVLNGFAPGGSVGGTINLIPKRAGSEPLTQLTASYISESQLGGHLDVGRRFGENKEFGVRVNGVYRNGDTPIDFHSRESALFSLGLDYQGERVRLYADLGYQEQEFDGVVDFTSVAAGVPVPAAPDNHRNYDGPNDFSQPKVLYGTQRGEFDLTEKWTAFGSIGGNERKTQYNLNQRFIVDAQGNLAGGAGSSPAADKMTAQALEGGLRGRFDTGPVRHQAVLAYNELDREWLRTRIPYAFPASNIYNPTFGPPVDMSLMPDPDGADPFQNFNSSSTALADTLSILEERVQLTLGARYQRIHSHFIPFGDAFKDDALTPMFGLVVKPSAHLSLYTNYIEGLQEGAVAPDSSANANQGFPPFKTKQYELGAKAEFGRFGATVALYQITQPSGYEDPVTGIYGIYADQRHRGIDVNLFGEAAKGVRLLGGAAWIDSELTGTAGGINDGNRGVAVPELRLVLGAEWDTPFVPGLTLTGRVVRNDSMFIDAANTQEIPAWTRLDLGARYRVNKMVSIRANVDNALDESYWDANAYGQISLNEPRTFSLSTTFDF